MESNRTKLKGIGFVSIVLGILMLFVLVPESLSMDRFRGVSSQMILLDLVITIIWSIIFIAAGLSTLLFRYLSYRLYIGSLTITAVQYVFSIISTLAMSNKASMPAMIMAIATLTVVFFITPVIVSILGIFISAKYQKVGN